MIGSRRAPWIALAAVLGAPFATAQDSPDRAAATLFVAELDRELERGIEAYRGRFAPLHAAEFSRRADWLASLLGERTWKIDSNILDFGAVGDLGIALVDSTFTPSDDDSPNATIGFQHYLVFREKDAKAVGLLDADVDPTHLPKMPLQNRAHSKFGCRACNYTISATEEWLVVPHLPERSGCLEALSLYSLRCGVAIDVSIHVAHRGPDPRAVLEQLTGRRDDAPEVQDWLPPAYQKQTPKGMRGARAEMVRDGEHTSIATIAFGPVLYLFTISGPVQDCNDHAISVESVLANFMLRETDVGKVKRTVQPVVLHTGGQLDGSNYENSRHGVRFAGPEGWKTTLRCGGHLFHVTYDCADTGRRLSLRALAPPPGHPQWTTGTADWSLDFAIQGRDLKIQSDSGWKRLDDGAESREVTAKTKDGKTLRAFRAVLCADRERLLIVDSRGTAAHAESLKSLLSGLTWE